jgi:hypothetical protein
MTPLVVLMMTAATAADPAPVFQGPVTPFPSYSSAAAPVTGTTDGGRPRLFARIRNFFNRRSSQPSDPLPANSYPVPPAGSVGPGVWGGTMTTPALVSPPATSSGTTVPAIIRPVPVTPSPVTTPAQQMPKGSPF